MSVDFFNSEKIVRLTALTAETKEIADRILSRTVRIFPKLESVKVDKLEDLWEMEFGCSSSTYALYVYALYPVSYLLNAYEVTKDDVYLNEALTLSCDFIDWEMRQEKRISEKRARILFGDHAVSNRTQVLCYLACCLKGDGKMVPDEIKSALLRNGAYLADINNYSHYNHGLMMDLSLLGLVNTLKGLDVAHPGELTENLRTRLRHSLARDMTEDGVHIENSPGYHFWMLTFLNRILESLAVLDRNLYLVANDLLIKANEYAKYITKPDGIVPAIGDTHAGLKNKPATGLGSRYFRFTNQVIFRSEDNVLWALLSSGYKTHVHKHSDNGSFNLFYAGRDIFVDPGFLNYENSAESLDIKDSAFHCIARPEGEDQNIRRVDLSGGYRTYRDNLSPSQISGFIGREDHEAALAVIAEHSGIIIERLVVWLKPDLIMVYDELRGAANRFEQFFHLGPGLHAEILPRGEGKVFDGRDQKCAFLQLNVQGGGALEANVEVLPGFVSGGFGQKRDSQRVRISSTQRHICTAILLGSNTARNIAEKFVQDGMLDKIKAELI